MSKGTISSGEMAPAIICILWKITGQFLNKRIHKLCYFIRVESYFNKRKPLLTFLINLIWDPCEDRGGNKFFNWSKLELLEKKLTIYSDIHLKTIHTKYTIFMWFSRPSKELASNFIKKNQANLNAIDWKTSKHILSFSKEFNRKFKLPPTTTRATFLSSTRIISSQISAF